MAADPKAVANVFAEAIRYTRAMTMLAGALDRAGDVTTALQKLNEFDNDLGPELLAALNSNGETLAALVRASEFLQARYSVALEAIGEDTP